MAVGPDDGSGGGYNGPPILTSSTFALKQTGDGVYTTQYDIAIGASAGLTATSPGPTITSYEWTGGQYAGYVSTPADEAAPPSQASPTGPIANRSTYGFIVGPESGESYTVTCTVSYQGGGSGTATLTFISDAPTGSLSVTQLGTQMWSTTANPGNITLQLSPGIVFGASASTDQWTSGDFMFMQVATSLYQQFTDPAPTPPGGSWYQKNNIDWSGGTDPSLNFNGALIDSGSPLSYGGFQQGIEQDDWRLGPNDSTLPWPAGPYTNDNPSYKQPLNDQNISASMSFSMYLMYQSAIQGSAWIALSEVDWSWSASATNTNGTWGGPAPSQQAQPQGPNTPSGAAAFPIWVNTTDSFKDDIDNPYRSGA